MKQFDKPIDEMTAREIREWEDWLVRQGRYPVAVRKEVAASLPDGEMRAVPQPRLAVIAGPARSGKTTFFDQFLRPQFLKLVDAEEECARLIDAGRTFAVETAFGRGEYWIELLKSARARGFVVSLFFISAEDAAIGVGQGIETAIAAMGIVDDFWLYDSSVVGRSPLLVAQSSNGAAVYVANQRPAWTHRFRLDLLSLW